MEQLRRRGRRLLLRWLGAGYSNTGYVRRMPVDVIKPDRTLIAHQTPD